MKPKEIETLKDLANYLLCDVDFLKNAIEHEFFIKDIQKPENKFESSPSQVTVSKYYIKKKSKKGGFRTVYQSWTHQHENSLKILNSKLNDIYIPNQFAHGFVKGKNIKTNATCHLGRKLILSVDVKNYFESITREMIVRNLVKLGFTEQVSIWISSITTIENCLVQGFSTSPTLANIITQELDTSLKKVCDDEIIYTRYADDLYFSTNNNEIPLNEITDTVEKFGFKLNDKKTKFMSHGKKQYVTGLTTFDTVIPRISKRRKRNIRLEIYYLNKFGYKRHIRKKLIKLGIDPKDPDFKSLVSAEIDITMDKLYGWLHFINSIEPDFSKKYYPKLKIAKQ